MIAFMDGTEEERIGVRIAGEVDATDVRALADLRGESVEKRVLGPALPFDARHCASQDLVQAWRWLEA